VLTVAAGNRPAVWLLARRTSLRHCASGLLGRAYPTMADFLQVGRVIIAGGGGATASRTMKELLFQLSTASVGEVRPLISFLWLSCRM
jgi:hypothetical protein